MTDESEDQDAGSEFQDVLLDNLQKEIESSIKRIMRHADSVQIIATMLDPVTRYTHTISHGDGNWHARTGSCRAWIERGDEHTRAEARKNFGEDV